MINTINNKVFRNANEAYEYIHDRILQDSVAVGDTKAFFNVGFYITDPKDRKIINKERNWKENYAEKRANMRLSPSGSLRSVPPLDLSALEASDEEREEAEDVGDEKLGDTCFRFHLPVGFDFPHAAQVHREQDLSRSAAELALQPAARSVALPR